MMGTSTRPESSRGLDAVQRAAQSNIHQYQIGRRFYHLFDGLFAVVACAATIYPIAVNLSTTPPGNGIVFDDENSRWFINLPSSGGWNGFQSVPSFPAPQ